MAAQRSNSSVIVVRARGTTALPAATIGYASLDNPDTYDPEKPMFKANFHYGPAALTALAACVTQKCSVELFEKLQEDADKNKLGKMKAVQSTEDWLEGQLKQPKEGFKVQLPFIRVTTKAISKDRDGNTHQKVLGCWDGHNKPLDLSALKLGIGSVVEPIVTPALYFSKLIGFPQPKLYLSGVRVLQLKRYGGSQAPVETDEDAIREALADPTFAVEDLSAFAAGQSMPAPGAEGGEPPEAGVF